ncbi:MAG: type II toxin-antitoxin system RelB/DinJ family antitoxin [Coriobacteriales bacterium]|jgi:DNA-damage-inducible protein J|nr:type II toxin-antitoxin system RelB/DinJ family antitoxin [Coriobacteriales bacterium]
MAETTNVTLRMDKTLKESAEKLFSEFGMNMTTALTVFLRQTVRQGKIPFEISVNTPKLDTLAAMREIEDMVAGVLPKNTQSVEDFFEENNIHVGS